jgi:hypothetical protein
MHFDSSRSSRELGLTPRPIRESLMAAVSWLRQTGQLSDTSLLGSPQDIVRE